MNSIVALQRIYKLCDVSNQQNRIPMVCSGKYDLLTPLAKCLDRETEMERLLACLTLNNLSIPAENKHVMTTGPSSKVILAGLCKAIAEDKPYAYLCCICLMNLSFLDTSLATILQYCPGPSDAEREKAIMLDPLENSNSFLRVLEKLLSKHSQVSLHTNTNAAVTPKPNFVARFFQKLLTPMPPNVFGKAKSVECIRWACGLIKNLSKSKDNAALLGSTTIPSSIVDIIRTAAPVSEWTSNSLEDFSLYIVLHLAQWPISREVLLDVGAVQVVKPLMIMTGDDVVERNQSRKATMACALLGVEWTDFPYGAAESMIELMSNIRAMEEQRMVLQRSTATLAFRELSRAAVRADRGDGKCTNKVMTAIDVCLQIISDAVGVKEDVVGSSYYDDCNHHSDDDPDKKLVSAEYAVGAIHAMLPSILVQMKQLRCEPSCVDEMMAQRLKTLCSTMSGVCASSSFTEETKTMAKKIVDITILTRPLPTSSSGIYASEPVLGNDFWNQYRNQSSSQSFVHHGMIV